jgi:alpha-beta hydrolase superfamily lysophospholipase
MQHSEGQFEVSEDLSLYYQCWLPSKGPTAVLLIVHGLAEHSGRYANLVNYFVTRDYAVYGFDQRGHGRSPGPRGYVARFSHFVNDLDAFLGIIRSRHQDIRIFLVGHSVGGIIATAFALDYQYKIDGLILSAPALKVGVSVSSGLIIAARLLSRLLPKVGLYVIDTSAISRDKSVVAAYVNDPLVYRGKIGARLGTELMKTMQLLPRQISGISLPVLIMHGTADRLSEPQGSKILYDRVSSGDKTLKLYDGFWHEIFNEPGREQVFMDMEAWLAYPRA